MIDKFRELKTLQINQYKKKIDEVLNSDNPFWKSPLGKYRINIWYQELRELETELYQLKSTNTGLNSYIDIMERHKKLYQYCMNSNNQLFNPYFVNDTGSTKLDATINHYINLFLGNNDIFEKTKDIYIHFYSSNDEDTQLEGYNKYKERDIDSLLENQNNELSKYQKTLERYNKGETKVWKYNPKNNYKGSQIKRDKINNSYEKYFSKKWLSNRKITKKSKIKWKK